MAQLKCDLAEAETRVVALKKEVTAGTKRTEEFRRLEKEYRAESEQLQLRMGPCSSEDTTVHEDPCLDVCILSASEALTSAITLLRPRTTPCDF